MYEPSNTVQCVEDENGVDLCVCVVCVCEYSMHVSCDFRYVRVGCV